MDITLMLTVDPSAVERARRLEYAIRLLNGGIRRSEIPRHIVAQFGVSKMTAHRCVAMAVDLVHGK